MMLIDVLFSQGSIYFATPHFALRYGSSEISQTSSGRTARQTIDLLPSKAEKSHHSLKGKYFKRTACRSQIDAEWTIT